MPTPPREVLLSALRPIRDPELGYSVVDLGLVYDAAATPDGVVTLRYTLTSPTCPFGAELEVSLREALAAVPGVTSVRTDLTFDPPWGPERIAPPLRRELRLQGLPV